MKEEKKMTQAIQLRETNDLAKVSMRDLNDLATMAFASGMFPDIKTAAQASMKILAGHELGFAPMVSLTGIHFFQGKVVVGANLMASLIKDSGKYEYNVVELTNTKCTLQFFRKSDSGWQKHGVPVEYTWDDAAQAGLTQKEVWKKFPADMLFASCVRKGARRYTPDLLRGMAASLSENTEQYIEADAQVTQTSAVESTVVEGDVVEPPDFHGKYREVIGEWCQTLNKAGDSIQWTSKTLKAYINELFDRENGLDSLGVEDYETLIGDLEGRFETLQAQANGANEDEEIAAAVGD